jgi:hypothetical protein
VGDTVTGNFGSGDIVVHAYQPIEGAQSLKLFGPVIDGEGPFVLMNAAPNTDLTRPIFIVWEGRVSNDVIVDADVLAYDETVLRIRFENGSVQVNSLNEGSYTPNTIHTVIIGLFPATDTFSLAMGGGAEVGGSLLGSLENPGSFPHAHLSLKVELVEADSFDTYTIDNVMISRFDGADAEGSKVTAMQMPRKYQALITDIGAEMLQSRDAPRTVDEALELLEGWGGLSLWRELEQVARDENLSETEAQWLQKAVDSMSSLRK